METPSRSETSSSTSSTKGFGSGRLFVLKVGTSTIMSPSGPDMELLARLADVLQALTLAGNSCVLVTSGAVGTGRWRLGLRRKPKSIPEKQAAAAVGQGILMRLYEQLLSERGMTSAQILLTRIRCGVADVLPDGRIVVERVVLLGEVADPQSVPRLESSCVGGLGGGQNPQQGGLAGAVETQHHHPRAPVDRKVDTGEHLQRPVGLAQSGGHQRRASACGRVGELDAGHLVGHPLVIECGHHPVGTTQHVLCSNGFGGFRAELGGL